MRGWSGLHAAMDFVVECQRQKDANNLEAQFVLTKVKDGTTGTLTPFAMRVVQLGMDEDGEAITSLVVVPQTADTLDGGGSPFATAVDDAAKAVEDDRFVEGWIRELVLAGRYPTGRYLWSHRAGVASKRKLTQLRIREAIERLRDDGRLVDETGGPGGSKWLRPVDTPSPQGAT